MTATGNTKDYNQLPVCSNLTATIASGETTSGAINLGGTSIVGLSIPVTFEGTSMTFLTSHDDVTYQIYKSMVTGATVTGIVGASANYSTSPGDFAGWQFVKLVAGTAQTGDCVITLLTRQL